MRTGVKLRSQAPTTNFIMTSFFSPGKSVPDYRQHLFPDYLRYSLRISRAGVTQALVTRSQYTPGAIPPRLKSTGVRRMERRGAAGRIM